MLTRTVTISTTDSRNRSVVGAVLGVCCTDDSTLQMVETRKQPPSLPVQVLLSDEVQHLEDAQVYFSHKNPTLAGECVDLLLGTQVRLGLHM
jgi:hypothetical protein